MGKLVLSRKENERIHLGDRIVVEVLRIKGNTVKIGITAPSGMKVMREELLIKLPSDSGSDKTE